jgi:integrase
MYKRANRWYSDFWYKGERYTESHGPVSKTVATEKDIKMRASVADGTYTKAKNNPPFDKALDEQLKRSKVENEESSYKRNVASSKHLRAFFGNKRIRSIENDELLMRKYIKKRKDEIRERQLKQGRTESELTFTTINRELALMRKMFNVLIQAGKATKNPVSLVTLFDEVERERVLTLEEEDKIIVAIEQCDRRYHHLKDMVIIALNTGMREGEILSMEKTWIDFKSGIIRVPRSAQKRKRKEKRVPINSEIQPVIERLLKQNKDSKYLFVNPGTGTRFTKVYNAWSTVLKKAGLDGKPGVDKLRLHDLRHTAATNLARAGKDIKFIAQYLGHTDVKTAARYIHYSDDDLKEGAEILARVPSIFTTPKAVRS